MDITWKYTKKVTVDKINKVESACGISLPADLRELLVLVNNGRPSKKIFDTEKSKGHVFKKMLSFNEEDAENIYTPINVLKRENPSLFPFASDPAGNFICLQKGKVVLWLHESGDIEYVADSVTSLLGLLY